MCGEPAAKNLRRSRQTKAAPSVQHRKSSFISFPPSQVWMIDWRSGGIPSRQVRTSLPSSSENLHVCLRRDERLGRVSWKEPAVCVGPKQEGPARFPEAAAAPRRLSFQRCEVPRGPRCGKLPRLRMQNSLPQNREASLELLLTGNSVNKDVKQLTEGSMCCQNKSTQAFPHTSLGWVFDLEGRGVPVPRPPTGCRRCWKRQEQEADVRAKTNYFIWKVAGNQTSARLKEKLQEDEGALSPPQAGFICEAV